MGARSSKVEPSENTVAQPVSTMSVVAIALRRTLNRTRDHERLELLPDKHGAQLQLSKRQQRLIELQHPGATRVVVRKLHGGFSGSLVLQTVAYDAAGRPEEPAVTKLDKAAALAKEIEKQDLISGELGPYAIRILRRPLYLGASGGASDEYTDSTHAKDADAAVVLELAGACWVLPEFFGKVANEEDIIVPFKQHLKEALKSGIDSKNVEGVFDDLYSVGGPLQRLACKATFADAATAKGGFVATALEDICREVARSMVPAQDAGDAAKGKSSYAVPASLLKAATSAGPLAPSGEVTKRGAFEQSFVHECGQQVWGDAACAPLIALAELLRAQSQNGASWLASWRPLQLLQHGDLNAGNVLIDARGAIWLIDFADTGTHEAFCDAAKLMSVLLFEYLPCDDEEMLRRGCAVVDAIIPTDGTRQLWEEPSPLSEEDKRPSYTLLLSLVAKVQHAACGLIMSASRQAAGKRGDVAAADVHPAALWLPLLREALRCLRYQDLSIWQKRAAWHAAQRLSMALLDRLSREPVVPPERRADEVPSLKLAQGQLLLLTAEAAVTAALGNPHLTAEAVLKAGRSESAPLEDCYELRQDGLYRFPDSPLFAERSIVKRCTTVAFDDMRHDTGTVLPGADGWDEIRRRAAEWIKQLEEQAERDLHDAVEKDLAKAKERRQDSNEGGLTMEEEEHFKVESFARLKPKMLNEARARLSKDRSNWAVNELRRSGVIEQRRYTPDQKLSVLDGRHWRDMTVTSVQEDGLHRLRATDSPEGSERCLGLHALNHAPLELAEAAFQIQRGKHANRMRVTHVNITDALSGRPLNARKQCVPISIADGHRSGKLLAEEEAKAKTKEGKTKNKKKKGKPADYSAPTPTSDAVTATATGHGSTLASISNVEELCHWLHKTHSRRQRGERGSNLAAVLLTAPPAAGKTCLVSQLVMHTLDRSEPLVPLVIKVMDLQQVRQLPENKALFGTKWNWADAYCCATLGIGSPTYRFLRQALLARRALLMLDGMDEGGLGKAQIEQHVKEVLLPQGHPMLLTSRPDSLVPEVYHGCARLQLCPLTEDQQRVVIAGRLRGSAMQKLANYVQSLPPDTDGSRLSGNPLMLNMLISIFESRQVGDSGEGGMPAKLQQVYELASDVMLGRLDLKQRGGSATTPDTEQLRWLLREVALEVHLQEQRQIPAETLRLVAARLGGSIQRIYEAVDRQLALGHMPLLSVIEHKPMVVQFSHLSFQEYFAAQAICNIQAKREELKPWRWLPWWGNAVRLGADCGERFGLGLLRATGLEASATLDLAHELEKGSIAALTAVLEMVKASASLTNLNLSNNGLGIEGAMAMAAVLKDTQIIDLNLSYNDSLSYNATMTHEGGTAIADCLKGNTTLASLNVDHNYLGPEGGAAIAEGLKGNTTLTELNLSSNALCGIQLRPMRHAVSSYSNALCPICGTYTAEGITALCEGLKGSAVTSLDLSGNALCGLWSTNQGSFGTYSAEGITALCEGLKGSAVTSLNIGENNLANDGQDMSGVLQLFEALPQTELTTLNLASTKLCGLDKNDRGTFTAAVITLLCEGLKKSAVTSLNVDGNNLNDATKQALRSATGSGVKLTDDTYCQRPT